MKAVGRIEQKLSSGLIVRQDIRDCVRFVMFETGYTGWEYATEGGTAFIIRFSSRYFVLTCEHVRGTFHWKQLALTTTKFGTSIAGVETVARAHGTDFSAETDISDMAVLELQADMPLVTFDDTAYLLDDGTWCTSGRGDELMICGAHKAQSVIDGENGTIIPSFHVLMANDVGGHATDPTLRSAAARTAAPVRGGITGLSGAPVFNLTQRKLAGVMSRGGVVGCDVSIHYIEIKHYIRMLEALVQGVDEVRYPISN
ncbi:MAG: hypothetical protein QOE79_1838 [Sphingomonadales bacterium]|nr:hypothetical protein [Sphingomonadales bacterium]